MPRSRFESRNTCFIQQIVYYRGYEENKFVKSFLLDQYFEFMAILNKIHYFFFSMVKPNTSILSTFTMSIMTEYMSQVCCRSSRNFLSQGWRWILKWKGMILETWFREVKAISSEEEILKILRIGCPFSSKKDKSNIVREILRSICVKVSQEAYIESSWDVTRLLSLLYFILFVYSIIYFILFHLFFIYKFYIFLFIYWIILIFACFWQWNNSDPSNFFKK